MTYEEMIIQISVSAEEAMNQLDLISAKIRNFAKEGAESQKAGFGTEDALNFGDVTKSVLKSTGDAFKDTAKDAVKSLKSTSDASVTLSNVLGIVGDSASSILTQGLIGAGVDLFLKGISSIITWSQQLQAEQQKAKLQAIETSEGTIESYKNSSEAAKEYGEEYAKLRHKTRSKGEEERFLWLQSQLASLMGTTTDAIFSQSANLEAWWKQVGLFLGQNMDGVIQEMESKEAILEGLAYDAGNALDIQRNTAVYEVANRPYTTNMMDPMAYAKEFADTEQAYENLFVGKLDSLLSGMESEGKVFSGNMRELLVQSYSNGFAITDEMLNSEDDLVDVLGNAMYKSYGTVEKMLESPEFSEAFANTNSLTSRLLTGDMSVEEAVEQAQVYTETMMSYLLPFYQSIYGEGEKATEEANAMMEKLVDPNLVGQSAEELKAYCEAVRESGQVHSETAETMKEYLDTVDDLNSKMSKLSVQKKALDEVKKYANQLKTAKKNSKEYSDALAGINKNLKDSGVQWDGNTQSVKELGDAIQTTEDGMTTSISGIESELLGMITWAENTQKSLVMQGDIDVETDPGIQALNGLIKVARIALALLSLISGNGTGDGDGDGEGTPPPRGGGGKKKSKEEEAEEAAKKAEELRKEAIRRDYDYIDHKRHLNEITLEEELALLEKIRVNHQLNAEEIMDWERKIYDLKKELRERDEESIEKLGDSVVDALEARYEAMRDAELDRLDESRKAWEQWRDDSVKAIEDQIAALDKLADTEDREKKDAEELRKIAKIKQDIEFERDDYNRAKLQQQLESAIAAREERLRRLELEDQKEALREQIEGIEEKADAELELLDKEEEKINAAYEERLKEAALRAEAEKLILTKSQDELLALLKEYAPEYDALGKTMGEKLVDGFEKKVVDIAEWFENFNNAMVHFQDQFAQDIINTMDKFQQQHSQRQNTPAPTPAPTIINNTTNFYEPVETPSQVARRIEQVNEELAVLLA